MEPAPGLLQLLEPWQHKLAPYRSVVGVTEGVSWSWEDSKEIGIGNLVADSMAGLYNDTTIAIINNRRELILDRGFSKVVFAFTFLLIDLWKLNNYDIVDQSASSRLERYQPISELYLTKAF